MMVYDLPVAIKRGKQVNEEGRNNWDFPLRYLCCLLFKRNAFHK